MPWLEHSFENPGWQSGFEHITDHECFGASTRDCEIVHGAVNGEFADRTARKAKWLDDKTVGGDRNFCAVEIDVRSITEWATPSAEKQRGEKAFDELAAGFTSGSVRHLDLCIAEPRERRFVGHGALRIQAIELRLTIGALRCS